jgi:hypothetical protein
VLVAFPTGNLYSILILDAMREDTYIWMTIFSNVYLDTWLDTITFRSLLPGECVTKRTFRFPFLYILVGVSLRANSQGIKQCFPAAE